MKRNALSLFLILGILGGIGVGNGSAQSPRGGAQRPAPKPRVNLNPRVTITFPGIPLPQAISLLFSLASLRNAHETRISGSEKKVRGEYTDLPLEEVLWDILNQAGGLTYRIIDDKKYLIEPGSLPRQRPSEQRKPTNPELGAYLPRASAERPDLVLLAGHAEEVDSLAMSPNEEYIASSSGDDVTYVWRRSTNRPLRALPGRASFPAFSADGKRLLTSQGNNVLAWDVETGRLVGRGLKAHAVIVNQVAPSPKFADVFATSGYDGKENAVKLWNGPSRPFAIGTGRDSYRVAFSPDSSLLVGWNVNKVALWDMQGKPLTEFGVRSVTAAAISKDNLWLALATDRGVVRLFSIASEARQVRELAHIACPSATPAEISNSEAGALPINFVPLTVAFHPTLPATLAVTQPGGRISVFELGLRQRIGQLTGHASRFSNLGTRTIAYAPQGKNLLSSGHHVGSEERQIKLWNLDNNESVALDYTSRGITYVAQGGPRGRYLLAGGQHGIWHWDLAMTRAPLKLPLKLPLVLSPDREWFASPMETPSEATVNDVLAPERGFVGSPTKAPEQHLSGTEAAKREKALKLRSMKPVRGVGLWDMETGTCLRVLKPFAGTEGRCQAIAFSNDGSTVLAGGWSDNSIHLWDRNTGEIFLPLSGQHKSPVRQLQLSGNDLYLLSQEETGAFVLWNLALNQVHARPQEGKLFYESKPRDDEELRQRGIEFVPFAKFPIADKEHSEWGVVSLKLGGGARSPYVPLATLYNRKVRLYNVETGEPRPLWSGSAFTDEVPGTAVQFTPEGSYLLVSNERETVKYRLSDGAAVERLPLSGQLVARPVKGGDVMVMGRRSDDPRTAAWSANGQNGVFATGHVSPIVSQDASYDGKLMVTGGQDGTFRLWDVGKGLEIATFIATSDDTTLEVARPLKPREMPLAAPSDYIVARSDSYYMASKGALSKVSFRLRDATYPFEQFDLRLNRPDILLNSLHHWYPQVPPALIRRKEQAYQARMAKFKLEARELRVEDLELPTIAYVGASPSSTVKTKQLAVAVQASDERFSIVQFAVYINGSYVDLPNLAVTDNKPGELVSRTFDLELTSGPNQIEIFAVNSQRLESLKLVSNVKCTVKGTPPRLFVLTIGVSRYAKGAYKLNWCEADARDMSRVLARLGPTQVKRGRAVTTVAGQYTAVVVEPPLLSEAATRAQILQKLEEFSRKTRPEDQLVVFIAGHGVIDPKTGEYYFGCYDLDVSSLSTTALSFDQLDDVLKKAPARQKLLLLDTCHSGSVIPFDADPVDDDESSPEESATRVLGSAMVKRGIRGLPAAPQMPAEAAGKRPRDWAAEVQDVFADLRRGSGAEVLAASVGLEKALENPMVGHGVFTYGLLRALEKGMATLRAGADTHDQKGKPTADGLLDISELLDFVGTISYRVTGGEQRPAARRTSTDFPFRLSVGFGLSGTIEPPKVIKK